MNEPEKYEIKRWDLVPFVNGRGIDIGPDKPVFRHAMRIGIGQLDGMADNYYDFVCLREKLSRGLVQDAWDKLQIGGRLILWEETAKGVDVVEALGGRSWRWIWHDEDETRFLTVFEKAEIGQREDISARPARCAAVARPGGVVGYGDALWASSVIAQLHGMGFHVTAYVDKAGEEALRHDPHVGRFVVGALMMLGQEEIFDYFRHECGRYDRWVNLTHAVEATLLIEPTQPMSLWPQAARHDRTNENYLAALHAVAGLPYVPAQKFFPTEAETGHARSLRSLYAENVVLVDTGTTDTKWWPYMPKLALDLVERYPEMLVQVLGKVRSEFPQHPRIRVIGMDKDWRQAAAICVEADVVVGQETGLLNAVAFEPNHKVVLLTHSSVENLTRDWVNTTSIAADGLPCYPCHILHFKGFSRCHQHKETGAAWCQATIQPDWVMDAIVKALAPQEAVVA